MPLRRPLPLPKSRNVIAANGAEEPWSARTPRSCPPLPPAQSPGRQTPACMRERSVRQRRERSSSQSPRPGPGRETRQADSHLPTGARKHDLKGAWMTSLSAAYRCAPVRYSKKGSVTIEPDYDSHLSPPPFILSSTNKHRGGLSFLTGLVMRFSTTINVFVMVNS